MANFHASASGERDVRGRKRDTTRLLEAVCVRPSDGNVLRRLRMQSMEWVAVSAARWELRTKHGRKLGALVKFEPNEEPQTDVTSAATWAALPRGSNYLEPTTLRDAALMLLSSVENK